MRTELHFLGEAGLADGFRLAGFEVIADADQQQLEQLLRRLQQQRQSAFVILSRELYDCDSALLQEVRAESGRILLAQVPPLHNPGDMQSSVDRRIALLLGQTEEQA